MLGIARPPVKLTQISGRIILNRRIRTTTTVAGTASQRGKCRAVSGNRWQISLVIALLLLMQREQLLPINRHIARSFDTKSDLAAVDINYGDADVIANENLFPELATEY